MSPLALALLFARLVPFAVGGATALMPELAHRFVDTGLMSGAVFAAIVAIAQAAPGPNATLVALVGFHMGGVPGAAGAMLGFAIPPSLVTMTVGRAWRSAKNARLREALVTGLAPTTIGLVVAGGWALASSQASDRLALAVTAVSAVLALARPSLGALALAGGAIAFVLRPA